MPAHTLRLLFATTVLSLVAGCATLPTDTPQDEAHSTGASADSTDDRQAEWPNERAMLKQQLADLPGLTLQAREDGALLLRLPAADGFARNSADPVDSLRAMLDRVAEVLVPLEHTQIKVLGHTDSMGNELYNLQLSIRRAETVMDYLRSRGIALTRLSADGRGEAEPIANNREETGRAINRRVELIVRPQE